MSIYDQMIVFVLFKYIGLRYLFPARFARTHYEVRV